MRRLTTISFYSTLATANNKTLVSQRINQKFRVKEIRAYFDVASDYLTKLSFFVSPDDSAPTAAAPTGTNLLAEHGQVNYITGDGNEKLIKIETAFEEKGYYIKVYAENISGATVSIDVLATIEVEE